MKNKQKWKARSVTLLKRVKYSLNSHQGSALIWVLVLCLVFSMLGIGLGWVALSMNERSLQNNNLNQAYFSARSGVDAIFSRLNGYFEEKNVLPDKSLYEDLQKKMVYGSKQAKEDYAVKYDNIFTSENQSTSGSSSMGTCDVEAVMSMGKAKFTATATVNKSTETVIMQAYQKPSFFTWPSKDWATILPESDPTGAIYVGNNNGIKGINKENVKEGIMDIAVYKVEKGQKKGVLTVSRDVEDSTSKANTEKRAIFIYLEEGAELTLTGMDYATFNGGIKQTKANSDKWFESKEGNYTNVDWENYYGPDVFIYMRKGSTLFLSEANTDSSGKTIYPLYIATEGDNTKPSKIETDSKKDVFIYYMQNAIVEPVNGSSKWLKDSGGKPFTNDGNPSRKTISGYKQAGQPYVEKTGELGVSKNPTVEEGLHYAGYFPSRWTVLQYERKTIK